jgi:hypothetical protein
LAGLKPEKSNLFRMSRSGEITARTFVPELDEKGEPLAKHYCHFGDIDYYKGFVFAPLEHDECGGPEHKPKILAFDTDLRFLCSETLSQGGAPWCAVNPVNGLLYSSNFDASELFVYRWDVRPGSGLVLELVGRVRLLTPDGRFPYTCQIQGGAFSAKGHLYLADQIGMGVRGFDMLTGRIAAHFEVVYDKDKHQELEGLCLMPISKDGSGTVDSVLHQLVTQDPGPPFDSMVFRVWMHHYGLGEASLGKV